MHYMPKNYKKYFFNNSFIEQELPSPLGEGGIEDDGWGLSCSIR